MAKTDNSSFFQELIVHSLKKDIPIIAYLLYLWFGVLKIGTGYILRSYGTGLISVVVILAVIIIPGLIVGMRVWRS